MAFSAKIRGTHHVQGNVQVYNLRIPVKAPSIWNPLLFWIMLSMAAKSKEQKGLEPLAFSLMASLFWEMLSIEAKAKWSLLYAGFIPFLRGSKQIHTRICSPPFLGTPFG